MSTEKTDADVAFIRALASLLQETDLGEIEVEREYGDDDALKVRLSRHAAVPPAVPATAVASAPQVALPPSAPEQPAEAPQAVQEPRERNGLIPSPMVGTVYLSPEPGTAQFVSVGDTVSEGQTLLIIEAMKTMNQIPSPRSGVVKELLVADAEPVEFGSPLLVIE